jgi:hypothetical protein
MSQHMNTKVVEQALRRVGEVLEFDRPVELLLVGGAAAMVTGVLPSKRVTTDCDVMVCVPPEAMPSVERAAESVAAEMQLAPNWLNSDVQIRLDALPSGWQTRKIFVGMYESLTVYAASRPDLIAMKVLAGREQDIEDLLTMSMRDDEREFVLKYLDGLAQVGTHPDQIHEAHELLKSVEVGSDE